MKAIQYYGPQNIRYEEVMVKPPEDGEIVVKVMSALTCGTDVKTFRRGHPVLIKNIPSGFGHEFAGIVEKVGRNVENVKVGDRVVAANSAPCGECFFCKREEYNLCENLDLLNGAYAEYITVPARIVKKNTLILPDNLSFDKAAFCEPLANVVQRRMRYITSNYKEAEEAKERMEKLEAWSLERKQKSKEVAREVYSKVINDYKLKKDTLIEYEHTISAKDMSGVRLRLQNIDREARMRLKESMLAREKKNCALAQFCRAHC